MSEHNEKEISAVAVGEAFRQVISHMKVSAARPAASLKSCNLKSTSVCYRLCSIDKGVLCLFAVKVASGLGR